MRKAIIFIILLSALTIIAGLIIGSGMLHIWGVPPTIIESENKKETKVCFKNNCFKVQLAITSEEQEQGLMFRKELKADEGMLFVFSKEEEYPFWMKNTLIPLDIIWINQNKEVVFISENTQPCQKDSCDSINPNEKAQYVLEVKGGTSNNIGLAVGDKIEIK